MTTIWSLAKLEMSLYRKWLPFSAGRNNGLILLIFSSMLLASVLIFRMVPNPHLLFTCLTLLQLGIIGGISTFAASFTIHSNMSHWWLLFPVSRKDLLSGKVLGLILVGLRIYPYFLVLGLTTYAILVTHHTLLPLTFIDLFSYLVLQFVILLIGLPVMVGFGSSMILFARGWAVIGMVPLASVTINIPIVFFGVLLGLNQNHYVVQMLNLTNLVNDLFWMVIIGYPAAILLFVLTYRVGLKRAADASLGTGIGLGNLQASIVAPESSPLLTIQTQKKRSSFWVLFRYEISRFAFIGQKMPRFVQISTAVVLFLFSIGGFFAAKSLNGMVIMLGVVFMLGYMGVVFPQTIITNLDLAKGNMSWWLLFPHSRFKLLASRMLARWLAITLYVFAVLLFTCIGFGVRLLVQGNLLETTGIVVGYLGKLVALFLVATILNVMLFQVESVVIKNPWTMFLFFPIYFSYPFGGQIFIRWILPNHDVMNPNPEFGFYFTLLCSIGAPLAAICFYLGAKYLNAYFNTKMANNRFNQWGNFKS